MERITLMLLIAYSITIFILILGGILVVKSQKKKNQFFLESKNKEIDLIHEYNRRQIEAVDKERENIGASIHDDLGQSLTLLWYQIEKLKNASTHIDNSHDLYDSVYQSFLQCRSKCKNISRDLFPTVLINFGLISGLKQLISEIQEITEIRIEFIHPDVLEFDHFVNNHLYRVLQELINNTLKHADAHNIRIEFSIIEDGVICEFSDDGVGLVADSKTHEGLGTITITQRLKAIGAEIHRDKQPSKGFKIKFIIPHGKNKYNNSR
jgi:signal transduction histidine kinase